MAEPLAHEKLVGMTLGNYRLEQLIEQKAYGPHFLARGLDPARIPAEFKAPETRFVVSLFSIAASLPSEARIIYLGRFQKEANQLTTLHHPTILPLLDYGTFHGVPYLVQPYTSIQTLHSAVAQRGPIDYVIAGRFLDELAAALEYAHQSGILHRNLTPECIYIQSNKSLMIAEFGLMRLLELLVEATTPLPQARIKAHALYGSTETCAPEITRGTQIDTYTDTYALGSTFYQLLTAHLPFTGNSREEIVQQHFKAQIPSLKRWRPDAPVGLDAIIARAMAKDPAQRFQHPGELADAYRQLVMSRSKDRSSTSSTSKKSQPAVEASGWNSGKIQAMPMQISGKQVVPIRPLASPQRAREKQAQDSRRRLLKRLAIGGGALTAISILAVLGSQFTSKFFHSATPVATVPAVPTRGSSGTGGNIIAYSKDLPLNSAKAFTIPNSNGQNNGILVHLQDNSFVAFNSTCTHAACAVDYSTQSKLLICPCHGAEFDPAHNASVVLGPAPAPLAAVAITVHADGTITTNQG